MKRKEASYFTIMITCVMCGHGCSGERDERDAKEDASYRQENVSYEKQNNRETALRGLTKEQANEIEQAFLGDEEHRQVRDVVGNYVKRIRKYDLRDRISLTLRVLELMKKEKMGGRQLIIGALIENGQLDVVSEIAEGVPKGIMESYEFWHAVRKYDKVIEVNEFLKKQSRIDRNFHELIDYNPNAVRELDSAISYSLSLSTSITWFYDKLKEIGGVDARRVLEKYRNSKVPIRRDLPELGTVGDYVEQILREWNE